MQSTNDLAATTPQQPPAASQPKRMIQLDVLRGLAILLVIGCHQPLESRQSGFLKVPATFWARIGWTGVDLFFVLSGFLVGGLLMKELRTTGKLDARRFIIRRGLKIWPSYYFWFAVYILTLHYGPQPWQVNRQLLPGLFHYQNYANTGRHTWSLAVEEHFYLMLPLLILLLTGFGKRQLPPLFPKLIGAIMAFTVIFRFKVGWHETFDVTETYLPTHTRFDSLFCGVLLAYCYHYHRELFNKLGAYRKYLFVGAAIILAPFAKLHLPEHKLMWTAGFAALYIAYGSLLLGFVSAPLENAGWNRFVNSRIIRAVAFIGTYSYSIYLWHISVSDIVQSWWSHTGLAHVNAAVCWAIVMSIYVGGSIGLGMLLGSVIEIPMLKLRDRLFSARATAI